MIETRGVGGAVFERAFLAATGTPLTHRADISGRTEHDIMRESLVINGIEPTDERAQLLTGALIWAMRMLGTSCGPSDEHYLGPVTLSPSWRLIR